MWCEVADWLARLESWVPTETCSVFLCQLIPCTSCLVCVGERERQCVCVRERERRERERECVCVCVCVRGRKEGKEKHGAK